MTHLRTALTDAQNALRIAEELARKQSSDAWDPDYPLTSRIARLTCLRDIRLAAAHVELALEAENET